MAGRRHREVPERAQPGDRFYAWSDTFAIAFHTGLAPWNRRASQMANPRIRVRGLGQAREMVAATGTTGSTSMPWTIATRIARNRIFIASDMKWRVTGW
jgi:hypothetical protein